MNLQRTIKSPVTIKGIGVHSGKAVQMKLKPARPNHGIVFVRTDVKGSPRIPAHFLNVMNTQLATSIGCTRASVSTVEHLMAALAGAGVDNVVIEINGPECPILDGSAAPFYQQILAVGTEAQLRPRTVIALRRKVEVKVNEKWAVAEPSSKLEIHASIDWDHPSIGYQEYSYVDGVTAFSELASARTFGFLREVEALKQMGFARGGSLANAVVLDDSGVLNPAGLRYPDEFVRHKVLDAVGDFKLAGVGLQAFVRLHRAGHDLHSQLMLTIFKDPNNFEIVSGMDREEREPAHARAALARGFAAAF
ncbi:UDP-3-O-acyl-N-acetylglucosamine deacetylase [Bdellovibrionota bacterium FG-2]